jgi:Tfp pilus assembly protein PilF
MAFCEQCGNKISDTAKFCGKCGTPVSSGQTEVQAEIPQTGVSANEESPAQKAFNAGMACKDAERYDEAVTHFTEAIRLSPDIDEAYYFRGLIYYVKEQYDSAIADFNQAIRIAPNEADYYNIRGSAYSCKDNLDSAIADFTKAIQLNPNDAETYGSRGMAYASKGDMAKARADCERGLQIDPNDETLAELAEGLKQEGGGGMSAPAAMSGVCTQCGAPLEAGEAFCANCGAKVGAAQYQSAPVQTQKKWVCKICGYVHTGDMPPVACPQCKAPASKFHEKPAPAQMQRQAGGDGVLKEGAVVWFKNAFSVKEGNLYLNCDRLEWRGGNTIIDIPIGEIYVMEYPSDLVMRIIMVNKKKYDFAMQPSNYFFEKDIKKRRAIIGTELKSWVDAINSVRNGTLG